MLKYDRMIINTLNLILLCQYQITTTFSSQRVEHGDKDSVNENPKDNVRLPRPVTRHNLFIRPPEYKSRGNGKSPRYRRVPHGQRVRVRPHSPSMEEKPFIGKEQSHFTSGEDKSNLQIEPLQVEPQKQLAIRKPTPFQRQKQGRNANIYSRRRNSRNIQPQNNLTGLKIVTLCLISRSGRMYYFDGYILFESRQSGKLPCYGKPRW